MSVPFILIVNINFIITGHAHLAQDLSEGKALDEMRRRKLAIPRASLQK